MRNIKTIITIIGLLLLAGCSSTADTNSDNDYDEYLKNVSAECKNITTMDNIEICVGQSAEAIGIMHCGEQNAGVRSGGLQYVKFEDNSQLNLTHIHSDCFNYEGKKVSVIAEIYECISGDQCVGIVIVEVKSIKQNK